MRQREREWLKCGDKEEEDKSFLKAIYSNVSCEVKERNGENPSENHVV